MNLKKRSAGAALIMAGWIVSLNGCASPGDSIVGDWSRATTPCASTQSDDASSTEEGDGGDLQDSFRVANSYSGEGTLHLCVQERATEFEVHFRSAGFVKDPDGARLSSYQVVYDDGVAVANMVCTMIEDGMAMDCEGDAPLAGTWERVE